MDTHKQFRLLVAILYTFSFALLIYASLMAGGVIKPPFKERYCRALCTKGVDCTYMVRDHVKICRDTCLDRLSKVDDKDLKPYVELEIPKLEKEECKDFGTRLNLN